MMTTRRALLAGAAALAATPAFAVIEASPARLFLQAPGKRDYGPAIDAILAAARAELAASGLPGMIMALTDDEGFSATLCIGWADLTARIPVGPDHLFEIGSISKSLTALALWRLAAEGRIDLGAPIARYLPQGLVPPEPISTLQLLDHVSGLPNFAAIPPHTPDGRLWVGPKPGARFYYSNTGYELAGLIIDAVAGRPHPEVIRETVLRPIGMKHADAHIRYAHRPHMATGYVARTDLTPMFGAPLVEGSWTEESMAAGAVVATADDMAAYLRYVIALGRGAGGPLFPDATAKALLADSVEARDIGGRYSSGFMRLAIDDRPTLHHTGGMLLFSSSFDVDAPAGVGAFASINGILAEHRPTGVTAFAVRALRAVREGKPLPPAPDPFAPRRVAKPDRFAGRWVAADGRSLEIRKSVGGTGADLVVEGRTGRLESIGGMLMTDLPGYTAFAFEFSASSKAEDAPLDRLWYSDRLYARDAAPAPRPAAPARLRLLAGGYRAPNRWVGDFDVVIRDGGLAIPGLGALVEDKRGFWRTAEDKEGQERFLFDTLIAGRPYRMLFSGQDCVRID